MTLNRYCELRYFSKGNQVLKKCYYVEDIFGKIPLYYSSDILKVDVMQFEDNSVAVIANKAYRETVGEAQFNICILHKLLKIVFDTDNKYIRDLHIAKWFSCSDAIRYIEMNTHKSNDKELRVNNLYRYINSIDKLSIANMNNIIADVIPVKVN